MLEIQFEGEGVAGAIYAVIAEIKDNDATIRAYHNAKSTEREQKAEMV